MTLVNEFDQLSVCNKKIILLALLIIVQLHQFFYCDNGCCAVNRDLKDSWDVLFLRKTIIKF